MDQPPILKSRKFWIMVADLVVSVTTYFVAKYVSPDTAKDVLFLLASCQPVIIAVIASMTVQNVAAMKQPKQAPIAPTPSSVGGATIAPPYFGSDEPEPTP